MMFELTFLNNCSGFSELWGFELPRNEKEQKQQKVNLIGFETYSLIRINFWYHYPAMVGKGKYSLKKVQPMEKEMVRSF